MKKSVFLLLIFTMIGSQLIAQNNSNMTEKATFGAGCFWCVEAIFQDLKGVHSVESGYAGGKIKNPTYREVCSGLTGHAEVVQIEFDPTVISFDNLVRIFYAVHDPTTLNRQGADSGTQYRSAIFYHNDKQLEIAKAITEEVTKEDIYENPIVTTFEAYANYTAAEKYHQNYFSDNPSQPYCSAVIAPKVRKFRLKYIDLLKK